MNAKTVDGLADISSLILALKALNVERVTFANKPIAVPVLHDSFSVLYSYFVSCYIIYVMIIIFNKNDLPYTIRKLVQDHL
jgi:hypothetical protein